MVIITMPLHDSIQFPRELYIFASSISIAITSVHS
jgi:hypothetical protein